MRCIVRQHRKIVVAGGAYEGNTAGEVGGMAYVTQSHLNVTTGEWRCGIRTHVFCDKTENAHLLRNSVSDDSGAVPRGICLHNPVSVRPTM